MHPWHLRGVCKWKQSCSPSFDIEVDIWTRGAWSRALRVLDASKISQLRLTPHIYLESKVYKTYPLYYSVMPVTKQCAHLSLSKLCQAWGASRCGHFTHLPWSAVCMNPFLEVRQTQRVTTMTHIWIGFGNSVPSFRWHQRDCRGWHRQTLDLNEY